jgi:RHS repeat-associated protein
MRVSKVVAGVEVDYVRDLSGQVMAEMQGAVWSKGLVYLNGAAIAQYWGGTTYFVHSDHLGSTRLLTALNQSVYDNMDYLPFGEQIAGGTDTTHKFTGKERDSESNLDMFGARYYGSSLGRFMTPDWSAKATAVPYADFGDPQSLNLYSYVKNNPLSLTDPDGHCCEGEASFLGQELVGVGKELVNTVTSTINLATSTQSGIYIPGSGTNIPQLESSNLGQTTGMVVTVGALLVAPLAEGGEVAKGATILENAAKGNAFQNAVAAEKALTDTNVVQNVTLKTGSGVRTVMDVVSTDARGNVALTEAKSSATAPLTKNQTMAHPEIQQSGATVVGQGKASIHRWNQDFAN